MSIFLAVSTTICLLFNLFFGIIERGNESIVIAIWKYFSYYTIFTNIVVCIWAYFLVFSDLNVVRNSNVTSAIAFYIVSVGVANYLIFGMPRLNLMYRLADLSVHAVTPVLTLIFWIVFMNKEDLSYALIPYWLIYPLAYAFYTGLHGIWTKFYPYPFTNIQELGVAKVMFNAFGLSVCVLLGGVLFVTLGKVLSGNLP